MNDATKETQGAGGVVLNNKGEVLVVDSHGNSWSLPKGHIDKGEDAREAAEREIYEESGVRGLTFVKELGTYQRYKTALGGGEDMSEHKTLTMFLYTTEQNELEPQDPDNHEACWVPREQVADLLTNPKDKVFFSSIIGELP